MIPRGLTTRILAAFLALSLAILVGMGGALFLVLRGLHAEATQSALIDLSDSILPQLRTSIAEGNLRGAIAEIQGRLDQRDIDVLVVTPDGGLRTLAGTPVPGAPITVPPDGIGVTSQGVTTLDDGRRTAYAATSIRARSGTGVRAIAFVTPDRSGALALADLGRTIPGLVFVLLVVGAPLAWLLSRSVTTPLQRLAAATADVPSTSPGPIPPSGPTEVRELTARFNSMTEELDRTRASEAELLANLRHDLRTPLTVIGGFAQALQDGTAIGDDAVKAARTIAEEAERLERMVDQLGAFERIRSGDDGLRPEPLDAAALVESTVARFSARAAEGGVALAVATSAERPATFAGDRLAVERILGNLVGNALDVVRRGGHIWVAATGVETASGVPGPAVVLSVTDDGPGFPPGATERVFDRFYRADPARAGAGSGLGLTIVRELARAHGGTAIAENVAPHGARVSAILPVVPRPVDGRP
ncbi:MAG: HAMP domain-containing sensor histidine kinase [Chloroflexota bacterium]